MAKYSVFIRGENLFIEIDGKIGRYGFYTTRYVEAEDENAATSIVLELIQKELAKVSLNDSTDAPLLEMEEIQEIESFGDIKPPGSGFSLFKEEYH